MSDGIEMLLGALAVVLGGAAFTLGGQVVRQAWRDLRQDTPPAPQPPVLADDHRLAGDTPGADDSPPPRKRGSA